MADGFKPLVQTD